MSNDYSFEQSYWGNCCNTFDEDQKHYIYARYMGIPRVHYSFQVQNKSILDIGGGPSSMLLKCIDLGKGLVVDPIMYPQWTRDRYALNNIQVLVDIGENVTESGWDEVWIYNCLQHVVDVPKLLSNALASAKTLRIFEWIDVPPHDGHPWELTKDLLDKCIGYYGQTVQLAEQGCYGKAYYGVFPTNN